MISSRSMLIAAAVAAALGTAGTASALDFATTNAVATAVGTPRVLTVAGASAQRTAFLQLMNSDVCAAGTLDLYRANPTGGQDFRAYSCHTVSNTGAGSIGEDLGNAANQDVVVYYRSEGGSAWGPYSIAQRQTPDAINGNNIGPDFAGVKQLNLGAGTTCNNTSAVATVDGVSVRVHECVLVGTYNLATDSEPTSPTGLANRQTQLGTADVEPKLFLGTNNPSTTSSKLSSANSVQATLKTLSNSAAPGFGQVFSLIVNNNAGLGGVTSNAGLTNLSSGEATGILTGSITDWCAIRPTLGTCAGGTPHPITVVRREPGSGTQVSAGIQFARAGCGDSWTFLVDNDPPGGADNDGVIEVGASAALETLVGNTIDAIGINILKSPAPTNTKTLNIDNVVPSNVNAANLTYSHAYETTYTKANTTTLPANGVADDLADGLITLSQEVSRIPVNVAVFAIPGVGGNAPGQLGVPNNQPTAIGTRGGLSCRQMQPQ